MVWRATGAGEPRPPDFSPLAERYARARPTYPENLFEHLAGLVPRNESAWDAATGNGQAAVGLAARFERVVATDVSPEHIRRAAAHPRIEYRVAASERSGLDGGSVVRESLPPLTATRGAVGRSYTFAW